MECFPPNPHGPGRKREADQVTFVLRLERSGHGWSLVRARGVDDLHSDPKGRHAPSMTGRRVDAANSGQHRRA